MKKLLNYLWFIPILILATLATLDDIQMGRFSDPAYIAKILFTLFVGFSILCSIIGVTKIGRNK